jgi:hypothetical protein
LSDDRSCLSFHILLLIRFLFSYSLRCWLKLFKSIWFSLYWGTLLACCFLLLRRHLYLLLRLAGLLLDSCSKLCFAFLWFSWLYWLLRFRRAWEICQLVCKIKLLCILLLVTNIQQLKLLWLQINGLIILNRISYRSLLIFICYKLKLTLILCGRISCRLGLTTVGNSTCLCWRFSSF